MKSSFPLAALALVISVFASLLACADVDRWKQQYTWLALEWPWRLVALFGGAALFGAVVSVIFTFKSKLQWRARLLALVAGVVAGQIGALILVAPGPMWRTVFAVFVLISSAILFRLQTD